MICRAIGKMALSIWRTFFTLLLAVAVALIVFLLFSTNAVPFRSRFQSKYQWTVELSNPSVENEGTISSRTERPTEIVHMENDGVELQGCQSAFAHGEMCPTLYADMARCDMGQTGVFDCPDIRRKVQATTRQAQLVITRMMRIFDRIARKHNIRYWLARGTLLGAARHKGFIPWDTDADIIIPLQDYVRFFTIASADLPADIFFQNTISDPAQNPSNAADAAWNRHKIVGVYRATSNPRLRDRKSCYKYCKAHGCKWHDGLMIDVFINDDSNIDRFLPLREMMFEGFPMFVPNNWKEIMQSAYGDGYARLPAESQRQLGDHPDTLHGCEEL